MRQPRAWTFAAWLAVALVLVGCDTTAAVNQHDFQRAVGMYARDTRSLACWLKDNPTERGGQLEVMDDEAFYDLQVAQSKDYAPRDVAAAMLAVKNLDYAMIKKGARDHAECGTTTR